MLKYITIIFALLLAILDIWAYRRISRSGLNRFIKKLSAVLLVLANAIPFSVPAFMFIFNNDDNGTVMMKVSMVLLTMFLALTLCRLVFYIFWLPTKRKVWMYTGFAISMVLLSVMMYGITVTRTDYKINEVELRYSNLPEGFDGYRVAFISDIHVGSMYSAERELEKLAGVVESTRADILVFGGDLVNLHHSELTPGVLEKLSLLKGREGVLAVLGNHDTGSYLKDSLKTPRNVNKDMIEDKVNGIGWTMLRDSTVYLYNGGDSISVTGLDYGDDLLKYRHKFTNIYKHDVSHLYSGIDKDVFNITISHLPQLWHKICHDGCSDLTLSGHVHAMQFKYNILGHVISPANIMYKHWSGLYELENGKLYINDGIGTVGFFARFGANPEVTVITLRCER